jgi:hypothetical protein
MRAKTQVIPWLRWPAAAVLATTPLALAPALDADGPPPTTLPPRPISSSIERVVDEILEQHEAPCSKAIAAGVPCFSSTTEIRGPRYSVRESLRDYRVPGAKGPNRPPPKDEVAGRPGPASVVVPLITVDPVCVVKSALKSLKGKNDTYFLYRLRDVHGERVVVYDHRLEASKFQGAVEFLGQFDGECDAIAAYRREMRRAKP